jgi:hypothetical protein
MDLFTPFIPFIFAFAIVYGSLEFTGTFSKRVNAVVSGAIALFALSVPEVSEFIAAVLPYAVLLFIALFFLGIMLTFAKKMGGGKGAEGGKPDYASKIVVVGLLLLILATAGTGFLQDWFSLDSGTLDSYLTAAGALLILLLIYWAFKKGPKDQ